MEVWDFYFASLVAWMLHPGNQAQGVDPEQWLEDCAETATRMMGVREEWLQLQERRSPPAPVSPAPE